MKQEMLQIARPLPQYPFFFFSLLLLFVLSEIPALAQCNVQETQREDGRTMGFIPPPGPIASTNDVQLALSVQSDGSRYLVIAIVRYRGRASEVSGPLELNLQDGQSLSLDLVDGRLSKAGGSEVATSVFKLEGHQIEKLKNSPIKLASFKTYGEPRSLLRANSHNNVIQNHLGCLSQWNEEKYKDNVPKKPVVKLDRNYGFKNYKFGEPKRGYFFCRFKPSSETSADVCTSNNKDNIGNIQYDELKFYFLNDELAKIKVIFRNYRARVLEAVKSAFGEPTEEEDSPYLMARNKKVWKGRRVKLTYLFRDGSVVGREFTSLTFELKHYEALKKQHEKNKYSDEF